MKIVVMLVIAVLLTSCGYSNWMRDDTNNWGEKKPAIKQVESSNPAFKVELIFETSDLKVYRFVDMAHTRYVAVKKDSVTVNSTTSVKSGKTTTYEDDGIETK